MWPRGRPWQSRYYNEDVDYFPGEIVGGKGQLSHFPGDIVSLWGYLRIHSLRITGPPRKNSLLLRVDSRDTFSLVFKKYNEKLKKSKK